MSNLTEKPTIDEAVTSFFDQVPPLTTHRNLRSILHKAFASTDEALNDPNYRCEMMHTVDSTCNFLMQLALIQERNVLKE